MVLREGCERRCPGCAHRMMGPDESEGKKEAWLKARLEPWEDRFSPISGVRGEARWGYRDRVCLSAEWAGASWEFGLIRRDELIPIPRCPIHSERVRRSMALLAGALPSGDSFPVAYYVQSGAQIVIVAKTRNLPDSAWLDDALWNQLERAGVEGVWVHLHPSAGKKIFSKNSWHLIRGKERSLDSGGNLYGPAAFHQLIPALYEKAADEAAGFLAPSDGDLAIDLYCGAGATLRRWTENGALAAGVELGGEAVSCAVENASGALVLRGSCEARVPQLIAWTKENDGFGRRRILYVNPPRTGLETSVLEWIITDYKPVGMAYLSCSAGTLRRDLDLLSSAGYRVERIHPYDFFPHTYHVETLVLLTRNGA